MALMVPLLAAPPGPSGSSRDSSYTSGGTSTIASWSSCGNSCPLMAPSVSVICD